MSQLLVSNYSYGSGCGGHGSGCGGYGGYGSGYGYGSGDGNGDGSGYGGGIGDGSGNGEGGGHGSGSGGSGDGYSSLIDNGNFCRDDLWLIVEDKPKVYTTREGHVVEEYICEGKKGFFVTIANTHYCAHGSTIESAITDALWKDESKRPDMEELCSEIASSIKTRAITLNEFRLITGACLEGCRIALKRKKMDETPLIASEIKRIFPEWGGVLMDRLEASLKEK